MPLWLLVWVVLFSIIALAEGGWSLVLVIIIGLILFILIYIGLDYLEHKFIDKEDLDEELNLPTSPDDPQERSKAIKEWEEKWGRRHPSRK